MKVLIAGAGKIGFSIAEILAAEGHEISVIDRNSESISFVSNNLDVICFEGNAANPQVLMEAGAAQADLVVAVSEKDETNMICAIISRKLGASHAIARVRDPEYLNQREFFSEALGLSLIVNPEYECAQEISRIIRFPGAVRVDTFSKGNLEIVEYRVGPGDKLEGVSLKDLPEISGAKVLVSLVERDRDAIIPNGSFVLRRGDRLSISGAAEQLKKFFSACGHGFRRIKHTIIVGGGRTSVYLARLLQEHGIAVTIIEMDYERCRRLSDLLPKARIICGDATNSEVLQEEGISSADAFVTLTGNDGVNIICSMYAKTQGNMKIVTKVNRGHFLDILDDFGLDSIVAPKELVTEQLVRYARAMNNRQSSNMEALYRLADGKVEALEFKVCDQSGCTGKPISQLSLKPNIIICALIRNRHCIIPDGSTIIEPGDHAVVICPAGKLLSLDDMLEVK